MKKRILFALCVLGAAVPVLAQDVIQYEENVHVTEEEFATIPKASILRIESDAEALAPNWSGVRSCSDISRARQSAEAGAAAWVKQKLAEHAGKLHLRDGWGPARWHYRNRRRSNGSRNCTGGIDALPVWIEFRM